MKEALAGAALTVVLAAGAFAGVRTAGFVQDDAPIVQLNPIVREGSVAKIFATDWWAGVGGQDASLYRPVTLCSFAAQRGADGSVSAAAAHLGSLAIHVAVSLLVLALIITKLIEGNYPNYRQVIPGEMKERVALQREEFLHALRRAEIMTSEKSNSVKLSFGKNKLEITANSPEVGEAKETLAINYKGPEMAIAFNPKYMIDPLNVLTNDEVFLELIDELSPGVLKINGPFLYVVMPMRLS